MAAGQLIPIHQHPAILLFADSHPSSVKHHAANQATRPGGHAMFSADRRICVCLQIFDGFFLSCRLSPHQLFSL
jgi:hypothetical protein